MSIGEVAKVAGVSKATVSRVINGHRNVSSATQTSVRNAMEKIGYSPAPFHHRRGPRPYALASQGIRTGNIGVVWFDEASRLSATHFVRSIQSISLALAEYGLNMVAGCVTADAPVPPILQQGDVDGLIVVFGEPKSKLAEVLGDLPAIWLSSHHTKQGDYVIGGNENIGLMAARYLYRQGHRQLVFMNPFPAHPALKARKEGFLFEAFRNNLEVEVLESEDIEGFQPIPESLDHIDLKIKPLCQRLVKLAEQPRGVFIPGDKFTACVYRQLYQMNIIPGEQFTIISADREEPYLAGLYPRPTTIDIGIELNAQHAVEQLIWRMRNPDSKRNVIITIEPKLIESKDSTESFLLRKAVNQFSSQVPHR